MNGALHAVLVGEAVWRLLGFGGAADKGHSQAVWTAREIAPLLCHWMTAATGAGIALFGVFAVVLGVVLIGHSLRGILTLSATLTIFFIAEGVAAIFLEGLVRYSQMGDSTVSRHQYDLPELPMIMTALAARNVRGTTV